MSIIRAVRLGFRFSRGAGKTGWLRFFLMCIGAAAGVVAMLQIWVLPQVLNAQNARAQHRIPVQADYQAGSTFKFSKGELTWQRRQIERVFVSASSKSAPVPPGIPRLPKPGEVFISPALSTVVRANPELRPFVPGHIAGYISPSGLTDPDDLYAYVGMSAEQLKTAGVAGLGFGDSDAVLGSHSLGSIVLELFLLIGGPAAIYLVTCARLSATTRSRRLACLRLLGMKRNEILIVAGTEGAVAGAAGGFVGLALFRLLAMPMADSGAFGFKWFVVDTHIGNKTLLGFHLLVIAIGWIAGTVGTRRALRRPLWTHSQSRSAIPSWLWILPLLLGLGLLLPIVWSFASGHRFNAGKLLNAVVVVGASVAMIGALMALRPLMVWSAKHLLRSTNRLPVRLAARRLENDASASLRVISGLMLLMFVSGIGNAVLRDVRLAVSAGHHGRHLSVRASSFAAPARHELLNLPAKARMATVYPMHQPIPADFDAPRIMAIFATCADVAAIVSAPMENCRDGHRYRLGVSDDRASPAVGETFVMGTEQENWKLQIPQEFLAIPSMDVTPLFGGSILITSRNSPTGDWPANTDIDFFVERHHHALLSLESRLLTLEPTAHLQIYNSSIDQLDAIRLHKGAITLGLYVGFSLGLLAFLVAAIDAAYERRASITALAVLGIPRRTLRLTQCVQLGLPLMLGLALSVLVGQLAGAGYLALGGLQDGLYLPGLECTLHLVFLAILLAGGAAMVVLGNRPRSEQLRRE